MNAITDRPAIFAVYNAKGGVGKTTTTDHLAQHLVTAGLYTLAIDLDPQSSLTKTVRPDLDRDPPARHVGHTLGGAGNVPPSATLQGIAYPARNGYSLAPSTLDLANVAEGLRTRNLGRVEALSRAIAHAQGVTHSMDFYDVILIDCPPDAGVLSLNALWAAHGVIVPCEPEPLALDALVPLAQVLAEVEEARGWPIRREYVATKADPRTSQHQRGLAALAELGAVVTIPARRGQDADAEIFEAYRPLAQRLLAAMGGANA